MIDWVKTGNSYDAFVGDKLVGTIHVVMRQKVKRYRDGPRVEKLRRVYEASTLRGGEFSSAKIYQVLEWFEKRINTHHASQAQATEVDEGGLPHVQAPEAPGVR